MLIGGCLHGIHIQCYIKVVGENNLHSYICPLCSTPLNCILPLQFDTENSEAYEISCSSITISLGMNSGALNSDSLLMLIFKHLVNSKGLNRLLMPAKYKNQRRVWRTIQKQL